MSDVTLQMILGLFAFVALMFVALGAGSNIYAAVFPQDTTTQDLAQRLEFLACENNFKTNNCTTSQRPAQMVFGFAANDKNDLVIVFERGGQEIVWDHTIIKSNPFFYFHQYPSYDIQRYTYTNPTNTAAVCKATVGEQVAIGDCTPLRINQTTRITRHLGEQGQSSYPTPKYQEYTELYEDSLTYGEALNEPGIKFGEDIILPDYAFLLYLEYTPPSNTQQPRLLVTRYDQPSYTTLTSQAARVGVLYDADPRTDNKRAVDSNGSAVTYRGWCYDDEWKYALPRRNQWHPASGEFYTINSGGLEGHEQLTQVLASNDFEGGLRTLQDYQGQEGYRVEIPTNSQAIRGACS